jgi:hypothetical protein
MLPPLPARPLRSLGPRLLAGTLILAAACGGAEVSAPNSAGSRVLSALQIESANPLPAAINDRWQNGSVSWFPPIQASDLPIFVPAQVIEVRDSVRAGEQVSILVNTIGENGCWLADGGTLTQRGDSTSIAAYDRHSGAAACTMIWTDHLVHAFTTTFPAPGTGVIRVYGRRIRENNAKYSTPIVAERSIVVTP